MPSLVQCVACSLLTAVYPTLFFVWCGSLGPDWNVWGPVSACLCNLLMVAVRSITVSFWLGEHGLPGLVKEVTQAPLLVGTHSGGGREFGH